MQTQSSNLPIVIGVSGASGSIFAVRLLQILRELNVPTHLVMSKAAELALSMETDLSAGEVKSLADAVYKVADVGAAIASGSFLTRGMVIAPCSVRTWSEIATGVTSSLLTRAADVTLKEQRKLLLMIRETPLHLGHLRSLTALAEMGAIIAPPVPAFYLKPQNIEEMVDHTLDRVLDSFGLARKDVKRWSWVFQWKKGLNLQLSDDLNELRTSLALLNEEHRDLDSAISALIETGASDQIKIARLKKRKLSLKDKIAKLQNRKSQVNPILLKVEKNAGHYGSSSYYSNIREKADIYGFIMYHLNKLE